MPRWHKTPPNDPILESRHPKLFAERYSEYFADLAFCHKDLKIEKTEKKYIYIFLNFLK